MRANVSQAVRRGGADWLGASAGFGVRHCHTVLEPRRVEQVAPRRHIGSATQQRTTLTLGHASPDTPLDLAIEGFSQTLRTHWPPPADLLGSVLRCSLVAGPVGGAA